MRVGRKILRAKMADYGEERKKDGNTEFTEIGTQRAQRRERQRLLPQRT